MDLRWRHIEDALVKHLFLVTDEHLGAFRAKIRHLKAVGIPDLPKVGSGTQISYRREHAIELYIALLIMQLGVSPRVAAGLIENLKRKPYKRRVFESSEDGLYLILVPTLSEYPISTIVDGDALLREFQEKFPYRAYSVIRVSDSVRGVDAALKIVSE